MDDAASALERARTRIVAADSAHDALGALLALVHELGGWTAPADASDPALAQPAVITVDASLGLGEPVVVCLPAALAPLAPTLEELIASARRIVDTMVAAGAARRGDPHRDPVTGFLNPRGVDRLVGRLGEHDGIAVLDLETGGASAGQVDEAMGILAAVLRHEVRALDHVGRLDATRFAVVTPATDAPGARALIGRIELAAARALPRTVHLRAAIAQVGARGGQAALDSAVTHVREAIEGAAITV